MSEIATVNGFKYETYGAKDCISAILLSGQPQDPEVMELIEPFLKKDGVVVDAGAYLGTYCIPLSVKVRKVVAFEPIESTFEKLTNSVKMNGIDNIELVMAAVGSESGKGTSKNVVSENMSGANIVFGQNGKHKIVTIDSQLEELSIDPKDVCFIKIDAEGMDDKAVEGAKEVLTTGSPCVFIELHTVPHNRGGDNRAKKLLLDMGYQIHTKFRNDQIFFVKE